MWTHLWGIQLLYTNGLLYLYPRGNPDRVSQYVDFLESHPGVGNGSLRPELINGELPSTPLSWDSVVSI